MKRLTIVLGLSMLLATGSAMADNTPALQKDQSASVVLDVKKTNHLKEEALLSRLNEIHAIATAGHLSAVQKNEYRNEVKDIQRELKQMQGFYVYLSLTALLVILILLLLL